MKTLDRTSSLFWLLVSILVFAESIRIGLGTVKNPGMGFMTFGASGILGVLSLVLFFQASSRKEDVQHKTPLCRHLVAEDSLRAPGAHGLRQGDAGPGLSHQHFYSHEPSLLDSRKKENRVCPAVRPCGDILHPSGFSNG